VFFGMVHNVSSDTVLQELAADACKGYGMIFFWFLSAAFLVDWGDFGVFPVNWDGANF